MTKKDLAKKMASISHLSEREALAAINIMIDAAKEGFKQGESLMLKNFGSFKIVKRKGKMAQNIARGTAIYVPPHKAIKFESSKDLRRILRNG